MKLEKALGKRLSEDDLLQLCYMAVHGNGSPMMHRLFELIRHADEQIACNAVLVFTRMTDNELGWLLPKRQELVAEAVGTHSERKRRLLMTLLYRFMWDEASFDAGFLDYCLDTVSSPKASIAVRVLAMKLAFEQCRLNCELLHELHGLLDLLDAEAMSSGMKAARRNLLWAMEQCEKEYGHGPKNEETII